MDGFEGVSSYLLVVALASLLVAILVWQPFRNKRTVNVWLASSVVGVLLGSVLSYATMRLEGYEVTKSAVPLSEAKAAAAESSCSMSAPPDCPMRAKMMAAAAAQGTPATSGPQPKRDLATLVQKLDLLTGDIGITLTAEQAAAVNDCLRDIEKSDKMSDDEAKAKRGQLMAVLNENQLDRLEAIGLPQPTCSGKPGGSCPLMGGGKTPGMMGSDEAAKQVEPENPFQKDAEGEAVKSLRERLASKKTTPKAETPKADPSKAAPPKADTPKSSAAKS